METTVPSAEALKRAAARYLDLHAHPELSGAERRTAARFAEALAEAGYEVTTGLGGHGVAAVLRNGPGPVVALRAELDALPVAERTGLPYASTATAELPDGRRVPVAHACGHDVHLACAAEVAAALAERRAEWSGTVLVLGQPAEETLAGARAMLAEGLYRRVGAPSVVLAQHTVPLPAGMLAHVRGPVTAGSRTLRVVVHGRGGHAGAPQLAVSPLPGAAAIVLRLGEAARPGAVLTVASLLAGDGTGNVIPDRASLTVTVRAFEEGELTRAVAELRVVAEAEAAATGCTATVEQLSASVVNRPDPGLAETVRAAHLALFGPQRVAEWPPLTATEDFPLFGPAGEELHGVPGIRTAYWLLGMVGPEQWAATPGAGPAEKLAALPANHSPEFRPHLGLTLRTGIAALYTAALSCLNGD
ncbi:amidohydrolase [Kitasatospora sp. MMS16-BH015]|uniref:amidohydrolase n=1 Tax=Kitasatospora sp. MMS16-BH015 TaxID=2018025 RepID=UPI000CA3CD40|nr:amidohydrolase [Kitasatospora sp. MMS16-BH015]AUG80485.1 amidohydrolase [Kitasatospora sp. MMS16-BH015]